MGRRELDTMKEQVLQDLEKFTNIRDGAEKHLIILVLTDIIAKYSKKADEEGNENMKSFEEFDALVDEIKGFLNGVDFNNEDVPDITMSIKESMERIDRMKTECNYCIRTLTWVKELIEEEEKDA